MNRGSSQRKRRKQAPALPELSAPVTGAVGADLPAGYSW